jgi:hypothetical protein
MTAPTTAITAWQLGGAGLFGAVIGWYVYYVNRHRQDAVQLGDITTLIGAIGGGAVLSLFDRGSELMGAYGIGLGLGFFGYFLSLICFVLMSKRFRLDWFLDARRKDPELGWGYPGGGSGAPQVPMLVRDALTSPVAQLPMSLASAAPAAGPPAPIVDSRIEVREIGKRAGIKAHVTIGNAQPGGWIAALDGTVVSNSSGANPVVLEAPVIGKLFEVSATMKATVPQAGRLSLLVTLTDDRGAAVGAPILIEHAADAGTAAAYSAIFVFTEAA